MQRGGTRAAEHAVAAGRRGRRSVPEASAIWCPRPRGARCDLRALNGAALGAPCLAIAAVLQALAAFHTLWYLKHVDPFLDQIVFGVLGDNGFTVMIDVAGRARCTAAMACARPSQLAPAPPSTAIVSELPVLCTTPHTPSVATPRKWCGPPEVSRLLEREVYG